jgi:ABC-2 type transport system permease protein
MRGWTVGFIALAALMTTFYPAMHQDGSIDALVKNLPDAFKGLVGDLANLNEFPTYIASQLFDIRMPIIAGVMAIILGLGLSVAEEETGELRTILSLPVSRLKLFVEKWLAMVTIMLVSALGLVAGIYLTAPFIEGADIKIDVIIRLTTMTWIMMVTFGTIPFAFGMATGKRSIASGVGILSVIGGFLLATFGKAVDWLQDYEQLSLLHYFPAAEVAKHSIAFTDVLVLVGTTGILFGIALILFRRRDIA